MEPLNLIVSLSHFADDKRENKHGLSERAGRAPRRETSRRPGRIHAWWRNRLRGVAKLATR